MDTRPGRPRRRPHQLADHLTHPGASPRHTRRPPPPPALTAPSPAPADALRSTPCSSSCARRTPPHRTRPTRCGTPASPHTARPRGPTRGTPPCPTAQSCARPHARRTFALTLIGRLSYATSPFSLTLALVATTGSYTTTGAVTALYGLTICALSPLRARLIDRHGPRRVLPPLTAAHALTLTALAAATWRHGTPVPALAALAVTAGATAPPLGVVMRTHWNDLLPDRTLLHRALSLDGVAEELLYVTGPLLAALIAATATPSLGIAAGTPLIIIGTIGLTTAPALPRT
ncbi:MFS transporter, partial [Actinomadura sp. CNU-125]|uniref:MFS transporter n=1 Tax=Actinomadura sp. CNU-125 TaxID=1904961 RepID=UPI0013010EF1